MDGPEPALVVVGGGSAGLGAARAARRRGASVVLVEADRVGGDCTFTGCVPSKALIEAAGRGASFEAAMATARRAISTIARTEDASALCAEGIEVVHGRAEFLDRRSVEVANRRLSGSRLVIATGAAPALPPIEGIETIDYLTNETLFDLARCPRTLAVLGGGPTGVEMAEAFGRLGSAVTVIEAAPHLLPREEPAAAHVVTRVLRQLGVEVRTGSAVQRAARLPGGARLSLADGSSVEAEMVLVAVGRRPTTEGLGLERAGVAVDGRGQVKVDRHLRTTAPGIFAAGDVTQGLQFTHVADETGRIAATNALSRVPLRRFSGRAMPWVTFTRPEVARVGMTEAQAAEIGGQVAFLPLAEVDRAVVAEETQGFVKLIAGPRPFLRHLAGGRIVGATIVAPRAGEMLAEIVLALRAGMFTARLATTTQAYPTWSTAVQQAAAQFFGAYGGRRARPARAGAQMSEDEAASLDGGA